MGRKKRERRRGGTRFLPGALGALLAVSAAGCAQPVRQSFDLAGAAGALSAERAGPALIVRELSAAPPTSSDRIVVRDADGGVFVLPDAQWSTRLPRLLRDRMIEALQRRGVAAAAVGLGASALAADIRRFEIDVARNAAVVELSVRLVDVNTGAARAAQSFSAEAPAPEHTGAPAAAALTEAAGQALARVAAWARGKL